MVFAFLIAANYVATTAAPLNAHTSIQAQFAWVQCHLGKINNWYRSVQIVGQIVKWAIDLGVQQLSLCD